MTPPPVLVEARRGLGTFVTRSLGRGHAATDAPLRAELTAWAARARAAGLDKDDMAALFTSVLQNLESPEKPGNTKIVGDDA